MDEVKYAYLVKIGRNGSFVVVHEPHGSHYVIPVSRDKKRWKENMEAETLFLKCLILLH